MILQAANVFNINPISVRFAVFNSLREAISRNILRSKNRTVRLNPVIRRRPFDSKGRLLLHGASKAGRELRESARTARPCSPSLRFRDNKNDVSATGGSIFLRQYRLR